MQQTETLAAWFSCKILLGYYQDGQC